MAMNATSTVSNDALREFVDQLNAPAPAFTTLEDFDTGSTSEALKWNDLAQDTIYQIISTQSINTQHGTSLLLSPQTADGFCYSAWACRMLTKELLFVQRTGPKTSKNGRIYHSYKLLLC